MKGIKWKGLKAEGSEDGRNGGLREENGKGWKTEGGEDEWNVGLREEDGKEWKAEWGEVIFRVKRLQLNRVQSAEAQRSEGTEMVAFFNFTKSKQLSTSLPPPFK